MAGFVAHAWAQEEPAELKKLRQQYQSALEIATKPLRDRYVAELKKVMEKAILQKNLPVALAAEAEMKAATSCVKVVATGSLRRRLTGTTWVWFKEHNLTLLPGGKARNNFTGEETFTWKVDSESKRIIQDTDQGGNPYIMTLDEDLETGEIDEQGSPKRTTNKIPTPAS